MIKIDKEIYRKIEEDALNNSIDYQSFIKAYNEGVESYKLKLMSDNNRMTIVKRKIITNNKSCTITQRQYNKLKNILETARIKKQINESIPSDRYITLPYNGEKIVLDLEPEDVIKVLGEIKLIKQNVATVNKPLTKQELADMHCPNTYRVQPSHNSELSNTITNIVKEELPKVLERLKGLNDEKI